MSHSTLMENILTARNLTEGFYWTVKGNTTKIGLTTEMRVSITFKCIFSVMWWGWAVLAALVRIIIYNVNVTCLRVHDPLSLVRRLTGPESASPLESRFCHFTLWLFIADLRSLMPLADALRFSKQGGFLLLIQMLNNLKGDPLQIR